MLLLYMVVVVMIMICRREVLGFLLFCNARGHVGSVYVQVTYPLSTTAHTSHKLIYITLIRFNRGSGPPYNMQQTRARRL